MKKYFLGSFAIGLAICFSAFSTVSPNLHASTNYYWYNPITGIQFPGNPQPEPSTECTTLGTGCANGFLNPDSDPVHDTPQATRKANQ